jgi:predicted MFS family arabinose efflux permease
MKRSAAKEAEQKQETPMALFLAAIWICYVGGAVLGTFSVDSWGLRALLIAVAILAIALATDQFRPLSLREEKEQAERS